MTLSVAPVECRAHGISDSIESARAQTISVSAVSSLGEGNVQRCAVWGIVTHLRVGDGYAPRSAKITSSVVPGGG